MDVPGYRLFLLRHGQTEWSDQGKHTGRTDVPLTVHGEHMARLAGGVLAALRPEPLVRVLSSPRRRAHRTAELAGLTHVETEPLLAEWDYGDYEGRTTPQIRTEVPAWTVWTHPCPGGETTADITGRADAVLARAREELTRGNVVLIGHGHFSRCLIARWLDLPISSGVRFALDAGGITVLGHERGIARLDHANILPQDAATT